MRSGGGLSSSTVLVAQVRPPWLTVTIALANERPARTGVTARSSRLAGSATETNSACAERTVRPGSALLAATRDWARIWLPSTTCRPPLSLSPAKPEGAGSSGSTSKMASIRSSVDSLIGLLRSPAGRPSARSRPHPRVRALPDRHPHLVLVERDITRQAGDLREGLRVAPRDAGARVARKPPVRRLTLERADRVLVDGLQLREIDRVRREIHHQPVILLVDSQALAASGEAGLAGPRGHEVGPGEQVNAVVRPLVVHGTHRRRAHGGNLALPSGVVRGRRDYSSR